MFQGNFVVFLGGNDGILLLGWLACFPRPVIVRAKCQAVDTIVELVVMNSHLLAQILSVKGYRTW